MSTDPKQPMQITDQMKSEISNFHQQNIQRYQKFLDEVTPYAGYRWFGTIALVILFMIRIFTVKGFYIVTYPKFDPSLELDIAESEIEEGPSLPTKSDEEFRPFIRRLPEFKFW
ncbi:10461_t:CDS:2 [Ambispora leptoticha]|uniref:10461_t:CDS:1 n=1 Tax=Ambispora leptoticha TaxID=144679 RepID=A0A9N8ZVE6_9GLOM|nr:10461_t:CDS:2 [Ambispora leptoticha]